MFATRRVSQRVQHLDDQRMMRTDRVQREGELRDERDSRLPQDRECVWGHPRECMMHVDVVRPPRLVQRDRVPWEHALVLILEADGPAAADQLGHHTLAVGGRHEDVDIG